MKKEKTQKTWLKVAIVVGIVLLLVIFIGLPFLSVVGPNYFSSKTFDRRVEAYWSVLKIILILLTPLVIIFLLFPFLSFLYPPVVSFWERHTRYFSLRMICLKHRFSYRWHRWNFQKKGKVHTKPNVTVNKTNGIYHLHFLDIPKGDKKVLAFINDREYRIYDTMRIKKASIRDTTDELLDNEYIPQKFRRGARLVNEEKYTSFEIPQWKFSENEVHMILISPHFIYVTRKVNEHKTMYVTEEVAFGNLRLAKWKSFKNELK